MTKNLSLAFDLTFKDLYSQAALSKLDQLFLSKLSHFDTNLAEELTRARSKPDNYPIQSYSDLLIALAPFVEEFIAELFNLDIKTEQAKHLKFIPLYECKRKFVQRYALKKIKLADIETIDIQQVKSQLNEILGSDFSELDFAIKTLEWLEDKNEEKLFLAAQYASWSVDQYNKGDLKQSILFQQPQKLDFEDLVNLDKHIKQDLTVQKKSETSIHERDGFSLTDEGMSLEKALDHAHYCLFCHDRDKDSCSKGYRVKKPETDKAEDRYQKNASDIQLTGCPLEEKISEMNLLKSKGFGLAALSVIMIDNPMVPATGHRICNECMKACVYQNQDPVDIPQIETRILKDILHLPWGFEIYSLLTRWNPLNIAQPLISPSSGKNMLVVGMGPAGFTLSHYLLNHGHNVVAIDGLKIEPLDQDLSGKTLQNEPCDFQPIYDYKTLEEDLDKREVAGFGGVAEYGITSRWNKNYLKVIRLVLERNQQFRLYGGIRFGGTLTTEQALELGFDHIALCMGAGKPRLINVPNQLAKGVRQASDFLMALQLTGAAKFDSLANLQIRLPVLVIGGGLTAIDTATEALAYYPRQVEKFYARYKQLVELLGSDVIQDIWSDQEKEIAQEFIEHAQAIKLERDLAKAENRQAQLTPLLQKWGGVKIVYRKRLQDAPSYRLNHEEVDHAFREGIEFIECFQPEKVNIDQSGFVESLNVVSTNSEDRHTINAKTIFVAAGTKPNTVIHSEEPDYYDLDESYFAAKNHQGETLSLPYQLAKPDDPEFFVYTHQDGRKISFHGDLHPSYAGNVVRAMASVKQAMPKLADHFKKLDYAGPNHLLDHMNAQFKATVHQINRLAPNIIEVIVHAPAAAKAFQPGQFYRLQNYEAHAPHIAETKLATEGLAMTGAWSDPDKGLLATIILEMGGSSLLCQKMQVGDPVILMGPTGQPTEIVSNQNVLLLGGGLGNAVLFSIGQALRAQGCKVVYLAGYRKNQDRFKTEMIEAASDHIIWCFDEKPIVSDLRASDQVFHGNIIQALTAYCQGQFDNIDLPSIEIDRLITIGSDGMMSAVCHEVQNDLQKCFKDNIPMIASINSPMQCMMKEICAQCLQQHIDPETGEITVVFSCTNQDQPLKHVDFDNLNNRLNQNTVQEKLMKIWVEQCLNKPDVQDVV